MLTVAPLLGGAYDRTAQNLEMRVGALTLRNEQLTQEVEKMKDKLLQDGDALFSEERARLLVETDELLAETDRMTTRSQEMVACRSELQAEASSVQHTIDQVGELREEWQEARQQLQRRDEQSEALKRQGSSRGQSDSQAEVAALREEVRLRQAEVEELRQARRNSEQDRRQLRELAQENEKLKAELSRARLEKQRAEDAAREAARSSSPPPPAAPAAACSESRLRQVMTSHGSSVEQLRQAIGGVEALLDEARRELASKQLRERRAAFEQLHIAMEKADEAMLVGAVAAARQAEVDKEDLEKAEAKLHELQSLTAEERAARAMRELELKRKKEAFLLVKKDDAGSLVELLDGLAEGVRWQDWRDYAGRTMWRCAKELRAARAQKVLAERLGLNAPEEEVRKPAPPRPVPEKLPSPRAPAPAPVPEARASSPRPQQPTQSPRQEEKLQAPKAARFPEGGGQAPASKEAPNLGAVVSKVAAQRDPEDGSLIPREDSLSLEPEEEEKLKAKALRAVVQDDFSTLGEVLELAPVDKWSRWENRAGKDLLTLSQERGSSCAYSVLAKALGMMREMKREAFEERETVWVFLHGEVQPRRATVLEDTPEEADDILVEYWDGDAPPEHVERCMVRRMWS